jgi:hypothetical protein
MTKRGRTDFEQVVEACASPEFKRKQALSLTERRLQEQIAAVRQLRVDIAIRKKEIIDLELQLGDYDSRLTSFVHEVELLSETAA